MIGINNVPSALPVASYAARFLGNCWWQVYWVILLAAQNEGDAAKHLILSQVALQVIQ